MVHIRNVVEIRGEKPDYFTNPLYYDTITGAMTTVSESTGEPASFFTHAKSSGDVIAEIAYPTLEAAEMLAKMLKEAGIYKSVTVHKEEIPFL